MEKKYIKNFEDLKDTYVRVDVPCWTDDNEVEHYDGVIFAHVKEFIPLKWDDEDEEYYDALECYESILADGEITYNDYIGAGNTNDYSYMTDEEKQSFIEKVSK